MGGMMAENKPGQQPIQPRTLRGFRDFLPTEALKRQYLVDKLREVFERYGYDPIQTPALEYLETFEGQIGEEEKLFYKFQDLGQRWVALRYDQTVPTARVVAQYPSEIALPFKRYQIQAVWRAERPQKGRYREFLQADADIFGVASPEADAEVIALSLDIYRQLGFKEARVLVNDRALFENLPYPVIATIDKLDKIGASGVIGEIIKKGFSPDEAKRFLKRVQNLAPTPTIEAIFTYLQAAGFPESWYKFEPTLARAFSYSTGPTWEVEIAGFEAGSVLGGERYDQLVGTFSQRDTPGTGFGLGFDRTLEAMEQFGLVPEIRTKTQVLMTVFAPKFLSESISVAYKLRDAGVSVDLYPNSSDGLDKQLKYADRKGIAWVVILGPEEVEKGLVALKDMRTGEQRRDSLSSLVSLIS